MDFNNFSFCSCVTSQNRALTNGFGHIFVLLQFFHDRQASLPSLNFIMYQLMHIFPMLFQCFHVNTCYYHFSKFAKSATRHRRHDALTCAHVQKVSVCVTSGAPRFGTKNCAFSICSKYVTCSITFCPHVLQITVCVVPRARRRSAPSRPLGGILAALAAKWRPKFRDEPALPGFEPSRPPQSASRA